MFLQPFLAGGVSIALQKNATAVRPLCCGDPIRRLVAKCFCLGGKDEISKTFKGKNFGVGCPGGVEVVAHSLRDVLGKYKSSDMGLLKIDFKNAFNLIDRDVFVRASSQMFPGLERWTRWCYTGMITPSSSHVVVCSKAILLDLFIFVVVCNQS